jgi:hypothetical protein
MSDGTKRAKEVQAAKEILQQRLKQKFARIDRHIAVIASKGFFTEEEILALAAHEKVNADIITGRLQCPVKKEKKRKRRKPIPLGQADSKEDKTDLESAEGLDKTVEKVIEENLKRVGKASLYQFLGAAPNTSDRDLLKRARQKEKAISGVAKKDAVVTASATLVGQCITIFKSEKSREAYDISRSRATLNSFHSDIDVAAMDGMIRWEYFDYLLKKATEYAIDRDKANRHFESYCLQKKYEVESPPKKLSAKTILYLKIAAGIMALLLLLLLWRGYCYFKENSQYTDMMKEVKICAKLEDKKNILENYIRNNSNSRFIIEAQNELQDVLKKLAKKDYDIALAAIDQAQVQGNFDTARIAYEKYIKSYPQGVYTNKLKARFNKTIEFFDTIQFEAITRLTPTEYDQRVSACTDYLKTFNKGRHRAEVQTILAEMKIDYYNFVVQEVGRLVLEEDWTQCLYHLEKFISVYPGDPLAEGLTEFVDNYKIREKDQKVFLLFLDESNFSSFEKATQSGSYDERMAAYAGMISIYQKYLDIYPGLSLEDSVRLRIKNARAEIRALRIAKEEQRIRALLPQTKGRFKEGRQKTIVDANGKIWRMVDSYVDLGDCIDWESAKKYVEEDLKAQTGAVWRLPSPQELRHIYKTEPVFPKSLPPYYWSNAKKKYSTGVGFSFVVDVVTTRADSSLEEKWINYGECGSVRAVRP